MSIGGRELSVVVGCVVSTDGNSVDSGAGLGSSPDVFVGSVVSAISMVKYIPSETRGNWMTECG